MGNWNVEPASPRAGMATEADTDPGSGQRIRRLASLAVGLAAAEIVLAYLVYWVRTGVGTLQGPDFFSFYAAAQIALQRGLGVVYQLDVQHAYQARITAGWPGHFAVLPYVHPPYYTLIIAPLGWLPMQAAYLVWGTLSLAAFAIAVGALVQVAGIPGRAKWLYALLSAAYLPAFVTLLQGQSDDLVLLGVALAALAWSRQRPVLAGVGLTLTLIKPQMVLLLPALFFLRQGFRPLLALGGGMLALVVATLPFGAGAWSAYARLLVSWVAGGSSGSIGNQTVYSLRGLLEAVPGGRPMALVVLLVALGFAALALTWRPHRPRLDLALASAWSVVLSPYQNLHDLLLMLPPMVLTVGLVLSGELRRPRLAVFALVVAYLGTDLALVIGSVPAAIGGIALAIYLTGERLAVGVDPVPLGELRWSGPRPRRVAVLPAYRAEKTLRDVVARIPEGSVDAVLLVDDASTDRTAELAMELGLHVIKHAQNLGYGGNQKSCYANALLLGAEVVVMLHPDGQYEPELVPALCQAIEQGRGDIVLGSRWLDLDPARAGMPWWKRLGNRFLTTVENVTLGLRLSEYHTGYRAYSRRFLETIPFAANSNDFVFDSQVLVAAAAFGLKIGEIPAEGRYFADASSVGFRRSVVYGLATLGCLVRYLFHRAGVPCAWLTPRVVAGAGRGAAVSATG